MRHPIPVMKVKTMDKYGFGIEIMAADAMSQVAKASGHQRGPLDV